jgi:hypothetical protein
MCEWPRLENNGGERGSKVTRLFGRIRKAVSNAFVQAARRIISVASAWVSNGLSLGINALGKGNWGHHLSDVGVKLAPEQGQACLLLLELAKRNASAVTGHMDSGPVQ